MANAEAIASTSASSVFDEFMGDSDSDEENFEGFTEADIQGSDDETSDDDEVVPRGDLTDAYEYPWLKIFGDNNGVTFAFDGTESAYEIFCKIIDDDLVTLLTKETNNYAAQYFVMNPKDTLKPHALARSWVDVTDPEMRAYLATLLFMAAVKLPTNDSYWSSNPLTEMKGFKDIMARDRWYQLSMFFHVADNNLANIPRDDPNYDRLAKIRPVVDHLVKNFQKLYKVDRDVSVDESIIAFKGRSGMIQYMPQKPHKWGIKAWAMCESRTGYCYNWSIYTGRKGTTETGLTHTVVIDMCRPLFGNAHHVYMDNFFSSPDLFTELASNELGACGTLRTNRKGTPDSIKSSKMKKGDDPKFIRQDKMLFVSWMDKKQVTLLTTVHNDKVLNKTVRCRDPDNDNRKTIVKPMSIEAYNRSMGGVDLMDQKVWTYLGVHRTVKWWKKIFFYLLELSFVNFTIIWKEMHPYKRLNKYKLRLSVIESMVADYNRSSIAKPRNVGTDLPSRITQAASHYPGKCVKKTTSKSKRPAYPDCVVCSERVRGGRHQTRELCKQCRKPMCAIPCFERYHTLKEYKIKCTKELHDPISADEEEDDD